MSAPVTRRAGLLGIALASAAMTVAPSLVFAQDEMGDEMAFVRVLHGVGDAPAVDVYAQGGLLTENLVFADITDYYGVPAGTYQVQVVFTGATLEEGRVVIDAALTFEGGRMTTVAATGTLAGEAGITPQVVLDDPAPAVDSAQARVVHLAYDAPPVDIAPEGGDAIISGLAYPDASDYLTVPPGDYSLEVRPAGETTAFFAVPALDLAAGTSYSVFAVGSLADETFTVVPAVDASIPTIAEVRILHGSPDAPPVDVVINGVRVFGNVPFGTSTPYLRVPAGENLIEVVPSGGDAEDGPPFIEATLPFDGGTRTTIVASNALGSIEATVVADDTETRARRAKIRVGHLSADAPNVDIATDGSRPRAALLRNVAYKDVSDYLVLKAGDYDLDVRDAGKKGVIADLPALALERATNYSAYAIGSPADGTFRVVLLEDAPA